MMELDISTNLRVKKVDVVLNRSGRGREKEPSFSYVQSWIRSYRLSTAGTLCIES